MVQPSLVLLWRIEVHDRILVYVGAMRDLYSTIAHVMRIKPLQANNFDGLLFSFLAIAADDHIAHLESIYFGFQASAFDPAREFELNWCVHIVGIAIMVCPDISVECRVIAFE